MNIEDIDKMQSLGVGFSGGFFSKEGLCSNVYHRKYPRLVECHIHNATCFNLPNCKEFMFSKS
jgi:hypothetical protein